jgi:hypothetical protein
MLSLLNRLGEGHEAHPDILDPILPPREGTKSGIEAFGAAFAQLLLDRLISWMGL